MSGLTDEQMGRLETLSGLDGLTDEQMSEMEGLESSAFDSAPTPTALPINENSFAGSPDFVAAEPAQAAPSVQGFSSEDISKEVKATADSERHARLRVAFDSLKETNGTSAKALKVSKALGVSYQDALVNLSDFEAAAAASQNDPAKYDAENPELARVLDRRPELAELVTTDKTLAVSVQAFNAARKLARPEFVKRSQQEIDFATSRRQEVIDANVAREAAGLNPLPVPDAVLSNEEQAQQVASEQVAFDAETERRAAPTKVTELNDAKAQYGKTVNPLLRQFFRAKEVFASADVQAQGEKLMLAEVQFGPDSEEAADARGKYEDIKAANVPRAYGDDSGIEQQVAIAAQGAYSTIQMAASSLEGAGVGGAVGAVIGGVAGAVATKTAAGAARGATSGARIGAGAGAKVGLNWGAFRMELQPTYEQNLALVTDAGRKMEPREAFGMAVLQSGIKAGLESFSFGVQTAALKGGAGALVSKMQGLAATSVPFRKKLTELAVEWAKGGASEGITGAAQSLVEQLGEYVLKSSKDEALQSFDVNQSIRRTATDAEAEALGGFGFGGVSTAGSMAMHAAAGGVTIAADARADHSDQQVSNLFSIAASDAAPLMSEELAQEIERTTSETGEKVKSLHVDAHAVVRYFQDSGKSSDEANTEVEKLLGPDAPAQLMEAASTGGRIEIPLQKVMETWGRSEIGKALVGSTSVDSTTLTPDERTKNKAEIESQAQEIAAKLESEITAEEESSTIKETIQQEAKAAGVPAKEASGVALLWSHFWETTGKEMGVDPKALFEQFRTKFLKPGETSAPVVEMTEAPRVGEDAAKVLSEKFAAMTPEQRASSLYVDSVTGLQTERAWNASPRVPGKLVAAITTVDVKPVNDNPAGGHDVANDLLRSMGAVVGQHDASAARFGTTFMVHVTDQAELDSLVQSLKEKGPAGLAVDAAISSDQSAPEQSAKTTLEAGIDAKRASGVYGPREKLETALDLSSLAKPDFRFSTETDVFRGNIADHLMTSVASGDQSPGAFESQPAFIKEAFYDPKMEGTLSREGFEAAGERAHVVAFDGIGLKKINDALGKDAGNVFLETIARVARNMGGEGVFFAHLSGDEFAAKSDDLVLLEQFTKDLQSALADDTFDYTTNANESFVVEVSVRYGIGANTYGRADKALNDAKRAEANQPRGPAFRKGTSDVNQLSRGVDLEARRRRADVRRGKQTDVGSGSPDAGSATDFNPEDLTSRPPSKSTHTPEQMQAAREAVSRMQPKNRIRFTRFLDFVEGWDTGVERVVGTLTKQEERDFAKKFGIVDPETGFAVSPGVDFGKNTEAGRTRNNETTTAGQERARDARMAFEKNVLGRRNQDENSPRGYYQLSIEQGQRVFSIFLNPNADVTTALHESAHAFLDILHELTSHPEVTLAIKDKWSSFLEWAEITDKQWKAMTSDERRPIHEKFAEGFEVYMRTGKAPSRGLKYVFARFSLWIVGLYKTLKSQGRSEISPKLTAVFDRLLATNDELKRALGERGPALFSNAKEAGVSEAEFAERQLIAGEENEFATEKAKHFALKEELRATEDWWKEELAKETAAAEVAYSELPAEQARVILGGNEELGIKPISLDRAQVEAVVGAAGRVKIRTELSGTSIHEAAEATSFPGGGDALVKALAVHPERAVWVAKQAADAMESKYPSVLSDRTKLRELVQGGLHAIVEKRILEEWASIRKKSAKPGMGAATAPAEAIKRAAELMVERRSVGSLNGGRVLAAERKAAGEKARAAAKGESDKAQAFALKELLNAYLYREVMGAKEEVSRLEERTKKMGATAAQARLGKASPEYRDGVSFILETFGLTDSTGEINSDVLVRVVNQMNGDGVVIGEPEWLAALHGVLRGEKEFITGDRMAALSFDRLTVKGMRAVSEALKGIEAAARARTTLLVDGKRVEKEALVEAGIIAIEANKNKRNPPSTKGTETSTELIKNQLNAWDGFLRNPIDFVREMTGDDQENVLWKVIVNPMRRAKYREAEILKSVIEPIVNAIEGMPESVKATIAEPIDGKTLFPNHTDEFSVPRTRWELLMMALNAGNESNLQRLTEGRNVSVAEVQAALNLLTKEEIAWVQTVFDSIESLKSESFALEERLTGIRPTAIKAKAMQLTNGVMRGGYFPAVYERTSQAGEKQIQGQLAALSDPSYTRPGTSHGHLKGRTDNVKAIISLSPSAIYSHLSGAAHDIAFREVLQSVGSFVLDKRIDAALKQRLGEGKSKQFLQWLKDVGGATIPASNPMARAVGFIKSNMAPAVLGWKASTALGDFANLAAAVATTGLKTSHLAAGIRATFTNFSATRAAALEKSAELRGMADNTKRQFTTALKDFTQKRGFSGVLNRGPIGWYKEHAFELMEAVSKLTATPVWLGAYRQALAEGKSDAESVRWADDVLTQVFPSHSPVEQSGILRDKGIAGASMTFYGYLSLAYRANARILSALTTTEFTEKSAGKKAVTVAAVSGRLLGFYIAYQALGELLMGRGPEQGDEDKEDPENKLLKWKNWFTRKLITAPMMLVPGLGDAASIMEARLLHRQPRAREGILTSYVTSIGTLALDALDPNVEMATVKKMEAAFRVVGATFGIPTAPETNVKYLVEVLMGEREVPTPADFVSGVIYGERNNQPETPITAIGDVLKN